MFRRVRVLLYFILASFLGPSFYVYAQAPTSSLSFQVPLRVPTFQSDAPFNVLVDSIDSASGYRVRPQVSQGVVYIWNAQNNMWVGPNDAWGIVPLVSHTLRIKVVTKSPVVHIWFDILTEDGVASTVSSKLTLFNSAFVSKYSTSLNDNLKNFHVQTPAKEPTQVPRTQWFAISVTFAGFVLGFLFHSMMVKFTSA